MKTDALNERRKVAAEASGGVSSDHLYEACLELIREKDLRGRSLDFGAGQGLLSKRLLETGRFTGITAVDLMDRPADLDRRIEWIRQDLNGELMCETASVDLILACEIIEHLENPREVVREWHRALRPGGALILTTPNNESWRSIISLIFRGHYTAFQDSSYPAHISALLRKDILRVLTEAGFDDPEFRFTGHGLVPKMTFLTWQRISGGLLRGLRYSDNLAALSRKRSAGGM